MKKSWLLFAAVVIVALGLCWQFFQPAPEPLPSATVEETAPAAAEPDSTLARSNRFDRLRQAQTPPPKTVLQRIAQSDTTVFQLSPEQVQAFLARNHTNAESLLAAFNATSDREFLRDAVRRYPSNALVLALAVSSDALPGQRRELLDQWKQLSPENPLANYLSARDYAQSQQADLALKEFSEAATKPGFNDYTVERLQGLEDLYLGAGYSAAEAKALAMTSVQLPTFAPLRELGRDLSSWGRQYTDAGDAASAESLARMGLDLANKISTAGANSLLGQIISTVVEREFLEGLDPGRTYDFLGQPVNDRLKQLRTQDQAIRESSRFFDGWMQSADDAQLVGYFDRLKLFGESSAIAWAKTQSGSSPSP